MRPVKWVLTPCVLPSAMCRQSGPDDQDVQRHRCHHTSAGGGDVLNDVCLQTSAYGTVYTWCLACCVWEVIVCHIFPFFSLLLSLTLPFSLHLLPSPLFWFPLSHWSRPFGSCPIFSLSLLSSPLLFSALHVSSGPSPPPFLSSPHSSSPSPLLSSPLLSSFLITPLSSNFVRCPLTIRPM